MGEFINLTKHQFLGVGNYEIPKIIGLNDVKPVKDWYPVSQLTKKHNFEDSGLMFFNDDTFFERVWNFPDRYAALLKQYSVVLSPDFSMYLDYPIAVQIFNHYRKHWLAAYFQKLGITVIPTISWSDEKSYDFCFDGEPKNSVVAVSNIGCNKTKISKYYFEKGFEKMLEILNPKKVLFFGESVKNYNANVEFIKTKCILRGIDDQR